MSIPYSTVYSKELIPISTHKHELELLRTFAHVCAHVVLTPQKTTPSGLQANVRGLLEERKLYQMKIKKMYPFEVSLNTESDIVLSQPDPSHREDVGEVTLSEAPTPVLIGWLGECQCHA